MNLKDLIEEVKSLKISGGYGTYLRLKGMKRTVQVFDYYMLPEMDGYNDFLKLKELLGLK